MDRLFKALNDPIRRGILERLREREMTAGEIADCFSVSKPTISHHLDLLKQADLILPEKNGQFIIYSLNTSVLDECFAWMLKIMKKRKGKSYEISKKRVAAAPDPRGALYRRRPALGQTA
ncbi:MAG TPA: autorepressor SdpR family transcription factor [Candidatus Acidoferrales bacterium]|jgi:ArsR family transcriptional regulator|nr:autorepressor SdpR family transcription factor [Candidatus Acidoferrales bacterium]